MIGQPLATAAERKMVLWVVKAPMRSWPIVFGDVLQLGEPADVDQPARRDGAQIELRNEAVAAGKQLGFAAMLGQSLERGAHVRRPLIFKHGRLHRPSLPLTDQRRKVEIRSVLSSCRDCFRSDFFWQEKASQKDYRGRRCE